MITAAGPVLNRLQEVGQHVARVRRPNRRPPPRAAGAHEVEAATELCDGGSDTGRLHGHRRQSDQGQRARDRAEPPARATRSAPSTISTRVQVRNIQRFDSAATCRRRRGGLRGERCHLFRLELGAGLGPSRRPRCGSSRWPSPTTGEQADPEADDDQGARSSHSSTPPPIPPHVGAGKFREVASLVVERIGRAAGGIGGARFLASSNFFSRMSSGSASAPPTARTCPRARPSGRRRARRARRSFFAGAFFLSAQTNRARLRIDLQEGATAGTRTRRAPRACSILAYNPGLTAVQISRKEAGL